MPNAAFKSIGPAVVLLGDPTTALGADMVHLGNVEDVAFDAGVRGAFTSSARRNGTPEVDGIYMHAPAPQAQVQLTDAGIDKLKELILNHVLTPAGSGGSTATTDTLGAGDDFVKIAPANVPTLCIVPVEQVADGVDAPNAIWFPATLVDGLDGINFSRAGEDEISKPYNIRFSAAYRAADQDATAIPAGHRIWFMGPPENLGLTWSLPANL